MWWTWGRTKIASKVMFSSLQTSNFDTLVLSLLFEFIDSTGLVQDVLNVVGHGPEFLLEPYDLSWFLDHAGVPIVSISHTVFQLFHGLLHAVHIVLEAPEKTGLSQDEPTKLISDRPRNGSLHLACRLSAWQLRSTLAMWQGERTQGMLLCFYSCAWETRSWPSQQHLSSARLLTPPEWLRLD
ncbi:hypothetical protein SEVIR_3G285302v4 [Setaria viridis]